MLKHKTIDLLKIIKNRIIFTSSLSFCTQVSPIKKVLTEEINLTERNFRQVDETEKNEFLKKNNFVYFEQEEEKNLELKKNQKDFEIRVRFSSKPPEAESGIQI